MFNIIHLIIRFSSVQFSHSVVSDSLWPHESQHAGPPCPLPTPGVHSDSYPSSQWCHPAISSSVIPFSSCAQSLPASQSFPMSQLFARGGQSTRVSALASFLPMKSQGWSPSEWTGWISLQSKGLSRVFLWLLNLNCYSLLIWSKPIFCWRNNWYSLCYNITLSHFLGGGNIRSLILYKLLKISYDFSAKIPHQFFI